MKKRAIKAKAPRLVLNSPTPSTDVCVAQPMLCAVRDEPKAEISALRFDLSAKFSARHSILSAQMSRLAAEVHGYRLAIEEGAALNQMMLDLLAQLFYRQDRIEKRTDELEKALLAAKSKRLHSKH